MSGTVQNAVEQAAPKVAYTSSAVAAGFGAWGVTEWTAVGALGIAVLTYVTGLIFNMRRDRREQRKFEAHLEETEQ